MNPKLIPAVFSLLFDDVMVADITTELPEGGGNTIWWMLEDSLGLNG